MRTTWIAPLLVLAGCPGKGGKTVENLDHGPVAAGFFDSDLKYSLTMSR